MTELEKLKQENKKLKILLKNIKEFCAQRNFNVYMGILEDSIEEYEKEDKTNEKG